MSDELPIKYKMHYHVRRSIGANWAKNAKFIDKSTIYQVAEYAEYASNFDQFSDIYPTFTIETSGEVKSESTFGDVGRGHFGNRQFQTNLFNSSDFNQKLLVSSYKNDLMFDVGAQIGIDLKKDARKLYLRPFAIGWIYSVGARWRTLNLSFNLTGITFHPK